MILYFDTSAFVPLLIEEPTSSSCREFWNAADEITSSRLLYVEAAAALAQAHRMGRLSVLQLDGALLLMDEYWREVNIIEVNETIMRRASVLARSHALRGYDAIHCASAEQLIGDECLAVTSDRALQDAWSGLGLATAVPVAANSGPDRPRLLSHR